MLEPLKPRPPEEIPVDIRELTLVEYLHPDVKVKRIRVRWLVLGFFKVRKEVKRVVVDLPYQAVLEYVLHKALLEAIEYVNAWLKKRGLPPLPPIPGITG